MGHADRRLAVAVQRRQSALSDMLPLDRLLSQTSGRVRAFAMASIQSTAKRRWLATRLPARSSTPIAGSPSCTSRRPRSRPPTRSTTAPSLSSRRTEIGYSASSRTGRQDADADVPRHPACRQGKDDCRSVTFLGAGRRSPPSSQRSELERPTPSGDKVYAVAFVGQV